MGAGRIHYACYYMQEHFLKEEIEEMMSYYPTLLEASIEFRIYQRQVMAKLNNQPFNFNPSWEMIPIADGYRVVKDNGNYYVLKGNETLEERKYKKSH